MNKLIPDFHVHSNYSPDSSMLREDAIKAAIQQGITDLCFTEHMDLGHHQDSFNRVPDFDGMGSSVHILQEHFPEINIYCGLEAGYIPSTATQTAQVLSKQKLDYVILSTHCVDGIDCYLPEFKRDMDKATAYKRYLETLYESVADSALTDYYDCIGHIGYIAKCRHFEENELPYSFAPKLFDEILSLIIRKGKGIEVNTSGIDKVGHTLPHSSIIQRYRELGGRIITVGSDAHTPNRVGKQIGEALQIVRNCGFNEIAIFESREVRFHSIV